MSVATGMAPPKPVNKPTLKDGKANPLNPAGNSAESNTTKSTPREKVCKLADANSREESPVEARKTRSRSETRGRRVLTCKTCKFTCCDPQEFTQHQHTAHAEGAESENPSKTPLSTRTRSSSRLNKRAGSTLATEVRYSPRNQESAKKAQIAGEHKVQASSTADSAPKPKRQRTSSTTPINQQSLKIKLSFSLTNPTQTSPAPVDEENSDGHQTIADEVSPDSTERGEEQDSPKATRTPEDDPKGPEEPEVTPSRIIHDTMISTSVPAAGLTHHDLNVSATTSEDEDMSEEGGRLIIDDSAAGGSGGGSGVVPTRCGNIQNRTYMCDDCEFTTTSAQQSLLHKKEAHGYDFTIYACNLCDYATKYKQKLPRHHKLHFSGSDTPAEGQIPENMLSGLETSPSSLPASSSLTPGTTTPPLSGLPSVSATAANTTPTPTSPQSSKRTASEAGFTATSTPSVLPAEVILEDGEDEEGEEDELIESDTPTPPPEDVEGEGPVAVAAAAMMPPLKKKRKDVSPDKYFEVAEEVANTKYGCAKCGNVYKWKKSLNKHWKEKHGNDPGDSQYTPPGMQILLQQQNHIQTEHRRCCHKTLLEAITVKSSDASSRSQSPHTFLNGHYSGTGQDDDVDGEEPLSFVASSIPVGPFVLGTSSQPVFPSTSGQRQSLINSLNAPISSASILNLTTTTHNTLDETDSGDHSAKPLDFSVPKNQSKTPPSPSSQASSTHPLPSTSTSAPLMQHNPTEEDKEVSALNELVASSRNGLGGGGKDILKCPKCGEVLKTQTAYSNHMAVHLQSANKRVAKCGVCGTHFPNNEALNQHFMERHLDHITSHKEAIQKIPHGLQQTYHLLKMPLQNISKLNTQETDDPLKCNMCEFTAKWPAELQKHAVSHSDERPFVCMVCGSTYKWKWDLVKHFEKAHSNLPNPYKRREAGAPNTVSSGGNDSHGGPGASGSHEYEMEEGEISLTKVREHTGNGLDSSNSFLFDQTSSQDDISVENILRTSEQASLMMSRQPNFLDSPENTLASSSATPHLDQEKMASFNMSVLQGITLPTSTSGLPVIGSDYPVEEDGSGTRHAKPGPTKQGRSRPKEMDVPYTTLITRQKTTGKARSPYKGYKTVEGSESSDLKYQCVLCDYKARWPSEIMQHMKNHSSEKPYGCPNCTYRSKWKWDVVKHLKRCGNGGTIKDVIDYTQKAPVNQGPPNATVTPEGGVVQAVQVQQVASPGPSTMEDPDPAMPTMGSESQASVLQAPYLASMAAVTSAASTNNLKEYVNLMMQHTKAVMEAQNASSGNVAQDGPQPTSSSQPEAPGSQQTVTYNSIINEGQHHCLHCTFVASSLAELRRHQVLHSDEKPYTCDECTYSTKWKCDMKKHKEKYQHNGPIRYIRPNGDGKDGDKHNSKKCPHCPFETQIAEALQNHVKSEHTASKRSPSHPPKFKCKECPFTTNELGDWINHRRLHQVQKDQEDSRQSPSMTGAKEHDEARLKHPRKAVKQYSCNKCDFVCLKSTEFLDHLRQTHGLHSCPFCSHRCDTKENFLEHLISHEEFNAKEFEHYFRGDSENEEDVNNNTDNPPAVVAAKKGKVDTGSSANTIDLTTATVSPPVVHINSSQGSATSLPCQWCDARFANVVRLHNHVSDAHPKQLREQEIAEGLIPSDTDKTQLLAQIKKAKHPSKAEVNQAAAATQFNLEKCSPSQAKVNGKLPFLPSSLAVNMGLSLLQAPTLVAQLGQFQGSAAVSQPLSTAATSAETGLNLSTKKPEVEQAPMFQCTKCLFRTAQLNDYHHHILSHRAAENMTQTRPMLPFVAPTTVYDPKTEETRCWFCAELHNTYVELYQHMQVKHHKDLAARPEQCRDLMLRILNDAQQRTQRMPRAVEDRLPMDQTPALSPSRGEASLATSSNLPNWLHQKKLPAHKGVPLQVLRMNGSKGDTWYKCIVCNVMDRNPAQISKHTSQVHTLPDKYQCGLCGSSYDKIQTVLQHHHKKHSDLQPNVIVLQYEELVLPVRQTARENSTRFTPSPFSPTAVVEVASSQVKGRTGVAVVKKEPLSSPPQASSSPADPITDCQPLDLSTEMAEDRQSDMQRDKDLTQQTPDVPDKKEIPCKEMDVQQKTNQPSGEITYTDATHESGKSPGVETTKADEAQLEFRCKHCPFTSHSNYEFRTHSSCHGLKSRYKCDLCSFSHNQLTTVTRHRAVHSHQPGYTPDYVPKLNDLSPADTNTASNASPAPAVAELLRCADCPYKTTVRKSYDIHMSMHGKRSQYICDFCDWSADRMVMLLQHRNIHSKEPDFDPSPEDHVFANPEYAKVVAGEFEAKLLDSKSAEEQAQSAAAEGQTPPFKLSITKKSYSCSHCPYVTGNRAAYDFHHSQHDGPGCYACEQCSYRTQHWSHLCQHSRLHDEHQKEVLQRSGGSTEELAPAKKALTTEASSSTPKEDPSIVSATVDQAEDQQQADQTDPLAKGISADAEGDESVEMAEFPDREEAEKSSSQASEASGGSSSNKNSQDNKAETTGTAMSADGELQCERCPFRTSSRLLLNQHGKHHSGSGPVLCPCCDYTCPTKETLLVHIRLHFPSTVMDMTTLQHLLRNMESARGKADPNKGSQPSEKGEKTPDSAQDGAAAEKSEGDKKPGQPTNATDTNTTTANITATTRVYACSHCDEEFEDKEKMKLHGLHCALAGK
ncbi:uncharacterized protein LOC143286107 [Babylonia areolata]|uniref:uncharacterized protein LOC143286107 n=1 Tax=Babylonia areolata TaxID=304850 RepID=UPI003FCF92DD